MKIFWSWQNDFAPGRNRWFIHEALKEAVAELAEEYELEAAGRPELDHDTKDEAGMVEITNAIFDKIAGCVAFVADLTPIARTEKGKALPSPNVLIELGWALKMPGWRRLVAVVNVADGFTPDDLPFDIRQRRALTYSLGENADAKTKKAAKLSLKNALVGALRRNLEDSLDELAAGTAPEGVAANQSDPSIWEGAGRTISFLDSFGHEGKSYFKLAPPPRAYLRLIPASWSRGIPRVTEIGALQSAYAIQPSLSGVRDGDFGACEEGFVRCWFTGPQSEKPREAGNVAMYFDATGELWTLDSTAFHEAKGNKYLNFHGLATGWADALRAANAAFDLLGAHSSRRVEFGIVGMDGVRWPGGVLSQSPPTRKNWFIFERVQRKWDTQAQHALLTEAIDGLRDLFGLPPAPAGQTAKLAADFRLS